MVVKVFSGTTVGIEGVLIDVEVDVADRGFPTFTIVGLPGKAVDEAKDRVRTAVVQASFEMPDSRITVNLAPADIPKSGSSFDLPIAVGILAAAGIIERDLLGQSLFVGELSLKGNIRRVPGVLSIALMAKEKGIKELYIPADNIPEACLIEGLTVYPLLTLLDLILHLNKETILQPYQETQNTIMVPRRETVDFKNIRGQEQAKRALEIAAAGFHNVHLIGTPGTGKTLLSRAFSSILPPMDRHEMLEVSRIYSVVGLLQNNVYMGSRPFRTPHHTTSRVGLIGGGSSLHPGEISLAHRGVLFLDEFPEFPRSVLESLRQPLEDGVVTIARASGSVTFPARFLLLAASNPCPCGYLGHPKKRCHCSTYQVSNYRKRISGPLADRIDLHISVPLVAEDKLIGTQEYESSTLIRERVVQAWERQQKRYTGMPLRVNTELSSSEITTICHLTPEAEELLRTAITRLSLSARSYFKTIKVAQTIADLAGSECIQKEYVAEALQFRAHEN